MLWLRFVNLIGAILWLCYGIIDLSYSIIFLNVVIVSIQIFKIFSLMKKKINIILNYIYIYSKRILLIPISFLLEDEIENAVLILLMSAPKSSKVFKLIYISSNLLLYLIQYFFDNWSNYHIN